MKKKKIILLLCCFLVISIGYPQTKQESIKELFHLMHKDSILDRTISLRLPTLIKMEQQKNPSHVVTESGKDSLISSLQILQELSTISGHCKTTQP